MQNDAVDMEWAWPPVQAERNAAIFAAERLAGKDSLRAYETVLTGVVARYLEAIGFELLQIVQPPGGLYCKGKPIIFWLEVSGYSRFHPASGRHHIYVQLIYDAKTGLLSSFDAPETASRPAPTNTSSDIYAGGAVPT